MSGFAHDIAGGSGNLVITAFQSPNFESGSTGWQVTRAGDAEFNSVTVRGEIIATDFEAVITVAAGPYAGTYTVQTGPVTTGGDTLAAISWDNQAAAAYVPPYIAAVTASGQGNITSVHSGQQTSSDVDSALWLISSVANSGSALVLFDCQEVQLFGSSGAVLTQNGTGFNINGPISSDSWHSMSLLNGWANNASFNAAKYRLVPSPPNSVEVIAAIQGNSATNNAWFQLPAGYRPASAQGFAIGSTSSSTTLNGRCDTSGNLTIGNLTVPSGNTFFVHTLISLDA